jgi:hypothetical protein
MEFWKNVRRQVLTGELRQRAAMKQYERAKLLTPWFSGRSLPAALQVPETSSCGTGSRFVSGQRIT